MKQVWGDLARLPRTYLVSPGGPRKYLERPGYAVALQGTKRLLTPEGTLPLHVKCLLTAPRKLMGRGASQNIDWP